MAMIARRSITIGRLAASFEFEHLGMAFVSNDAASDLSELLVHQLAART
jgi:hypothetical protein